MGTRAIARPLVTMLVAAVLFSLADGGGPFCSSEAFGQSRRAKERKAEPAPAGPVDANAAAPVTTPGPPAAAPPPDERPLERVEADVSTRSIAVTSGFAGTEIIVFGSVDNSRQTSAEAGYYDVVVVVEGASTPLVARRKSNVAGLWMNTASLAFDKVPSFYAVASSRPLDEIAEPTVLEKYGLGFRHVQIKPRQSKAWVMPDEELAAYREAVVRLKERDRLFVANDYDVVFTGRSLFRTTVNLPANVPVGQLTTRTYLFREGRMISSYPRRVALERAGIELWLYDFAFKYPMLYGIFAVAIAVAAGLAASAVFRRPTA